MTAACPESVESIRSGPGGFAAVRTLGNTPACEISLVRSMATGGLASIRRLHAFPKPAELRQLLAETNRLTGFEHPNVCPVVGAWVHDASVWCATEYTPGAPLSAIVEYGQNHWENVPLSVRLRILLDLTSGCAAVRSFDPQRLAMPILSDDVWVGSKGSTRLLPLTNMPDTRRGVLAESAPSGLTEDARDLFFLACLWWEFTTGKPLSKNPPQIPANVDLSEATAQFLLSVLTNSGGIHSTAEFWQRAVATIDAHEQVASCAEVAIWVHAACPPHPSDPVPEENAAQSSCRPQREQEIPEIRVTQPSVEAGNKLTSTASITPPTAVVLPKAAPRVAPAAAPAIEAAPPAPAAKVAPPVVVQVVQPPQTSIRAQKRPAAPMLQQSSSGSTAASASDNTTLEGALVSWADSLPQPERPTYLDEVES